MKMTDFFTETPAASEINGKGYQIVYKLQKKLYIEVT